ncbi:class I adenylate-forming enzyme family protein [Antrihabitans spumae]|uniref:Class I adenylate-forming enzyme family protein n=1 Tax=Antrihabitans spumae TaxID=3373370 RepID=A0ABW7KS57_9NOCA
MAPTLVEYPAIQPLSRDDAVTRSGDGLLHYGGLTPSLTEFLDVRAHRYANREAIVEIGGPRMTYRELWTSASRVAGGLQDRGIGVGDRVAIRFPNGVRWVQAFLGALLSGAVPVPVNYAYGPRATAALLADSAADFVLEDELPTGRAFIDDGACLSEMAVLCYTRGTTGRPRGVELSNENVLSAIESVVHAEGLSRDGIRNLVLLPLAYAMGCVDQLLPTLAVGGTVVVAPSLDPEQFRYTLGAERIDVVTATPADYDSLVSGRGLRASNTAGVRKICCAAGALSDEAAARLRSVFPAARQWSWWGATETSGVGLTLPDELSSKRPGTVGVAFGGTELALWGDETDSGRGELLCRGPNVMRGYWRDPASTARRFTGNWFHTGDVVEIDREGFVRMIARRTDVDVSVEQPIAQAAQHI